MPSGTIKRLVRDRGFGFIRDDGGQEWFFHRSSVEGSFDQLNEGHASASTKSRRPKGRAPATFAAKADAALDAAGGRRRHRLPAVTTVLLFDIDGTLVLTGGAGARAMTRAFEELFAVPDAFRDIPMAGPHRHVDPVRRGGRARHPVDAAARRVSGRLSRAPRARARAARAAQRRDAGRPSAARRARCARRRVSRAA